MVAAVSIPTFFFIAKYERQVEFRALRSKRARQAAMPKRRHKIRRAN
jgi:hypothetical protein